MRAEPRRTAVTLDDLTVEARAVPVTKTGPDWDVVVGRYLQWRQVQGLSAGTRRIDRLQMERLAKWCVAHQITAAVTRQAAGDYIVELDGRLSPRGVNMALQVAQTFGDWMVVEGMWAANPFRSIRKRREPRRGAPAGLKPHELSRLLAAPNRDRPGGLRDYLMLYVAAFCGLRIGELCYLRASDLNIEECWLRVAAETAKTRTERRVWLPHKEDRRGRHLLPEFAEPLDLWLAYRAQYDIDDDAPLFVNCSRHPNHAAPGSAVDTDVLRMNLRRYATKAGLPPTRCSPHKLRHTAGYLMGRGGLTGQVMPPQDIMRQLGHCTLTMAMHYAKGDEEDVRRSFAAAAVTATVDVPTRRRVHVDSPRGILARLERAEERVAELERR